MHKVFCIIGHTCSGKSTLVHKASKKLGMKILKSYTTRSPRDGETIDSSDHTFISSSDVEQYRSDMIAYTERVGYCSFATKQQLLESDFYIINPEGFDELVKKHIDGICLIPIFINVPYLLLKHRAKVNRDFKIWEANYQNELLEFKKINSCYAYFQINNICKLIALHKFNKLIKNILKEE